MTKLPCPAGGGGGWVPAWGLGGGGPADSPRVPTASAARPAGDGRVSRAAGGVPGLPASILAGHLRSQALLPVSKPGVGYWGRGDQPHS